MTIYSIASTVYQIKITLNISCMPNFYFALPVTELSPKSLCAHKHPQRAVLAVTEDEWLPVRRTLEGPL